MFFVRFNVLKKKWKERLPLHYVKLCKSFLIIINYGNLLDSILFTFELMIDKFTNVPVAIHNFWSIFSRSIHAEIFFCQAINMWWNIEISFYTSVRYSTDFNADSEGTWKQVNKSGETKNLCPWKDYEKLCKVVRLRILVDKKRIIYWNSSVFRYTQNTLLTQFGEFSRLFEESYNSGW